MKNSSQNNLSADCWPTHYQQSTNRSPTVGQQIPYGGEIIISVLAFNRYNLVNVARGRSQNSWLKTMETTHCYNLTEWSSFKERCLQKWSHKLEKSLHVLQFPLEYLLKQKTNVFEANCALWYVNKAMKFVSPYNALQTFPVCHVCVSITIDQESEDWMKALD